MNDSCRTGSNHFYNSNHPAPATGGLYFFSLEECRREKVIEVVLMVTLHSALPDPYKGKGIGAACLTRA